MPFARIDTGNGGVALTNDTARNAVNTITFEAAGNDLVLNLNSLYGIHAARRLPTGPGHLRDRVLEGLRRGHHGRRSESFLTIAIDSGQAGLSSAGYVPLPDKVKERLVTAINAMQ